MARKNEARDKRTIEIAKVFEELRLARGLSNSDVAVHMGVTHQQINKNLKGKNRMGAAFLEDLAFFFGKPVGYFFNEAPMEESEHKRQAMNVSRNFQKIKCQRTRNAVVTMVAELAG